MSKDALVITNAKVVLKNRVIDQGAVVCEDGVIAWVGPADGLPAQKADVLDAGGRVVMPGFIDTHIHGCHGDDVMLNGEEGLRRMSANLLRYGVTGWLPTTVSAVHEDTLRVIAWCRNAAGQNQLGAAILGIHLEGPYINPNKKGAQPPEGIRPPDVDQCLKYIEEAGGMVKVVTLAPELPGAFDLIRILRDRGVVVSLGHSEADYETAVNAIEAGASHATHLFNAMPPLHHRKPGLVLACINDPRVKVEIIADGVHLHPELVRMVIRSKGEDGVVLITDAMSAVGCPDGVYTLGTHTVYVKGDLCTLADGTIASSMLTMNRAVRNAVAFAGADLPQAARMASELPAEICGVSHRKGSIEVGKDADLVVLEPDFSVWRTVVQGQVVYPPNGR